MPSAQPLKRFQPDYIGLTILISLLVHGILIFGIGFRKPQSPLKPPVTLDVVLLQSSQPTPQSSKPKPADFLAPKTQAGEGNTTHKQPPRRLKQTPTLPSSPIEPAAATPPHKKPAIPQELQPVISTPQPNPHHPVTTTPPAPPKPNDPAHPLTTAKPAPKPIENKENKPLEKEMPLNAAALMQQAIARLDDAINEQQQIYAEQPRQKYISARTQEYQYASYMDAWRTKVERIGNLNYPATIKQQQLSGNVLLDVIIKPDGQLHDVVIITSSGSPVIDEAAINIARLASPYAPFPENMAAETDLLHITRTWKFLRDNRLLNQ